jgi:hypothetical protein
VPTFRSAVLLGVSGLTLGAAAGWLLAGPLDPPGGPVAPTHKTLTEVEPRIAINSTNTPGDADSLYKITQPGSYYLTGNLQGVAGKHGIEVATPAAGPGVTIDLCGFEMVGLAGMGAFDGVTTGAGVLNVTVRNGTVRNWGDEGVEIGNGSTAADLAVSGCSGFGIVLGQNSSAQRCRVTSNTAGGIATGGDCTVQSCSAQTNAGGGILAFNGCAVLDCTSNFNTGNGISTGHTSTVSRCSSVDNTLSGFSVGSNTTISNCASSFNDSHGFASLDGASVSASTASNNFGNGFNLANGATVSGCAAVTNSGSGIVVDNGGQITSCTARSNTLHGIVANSSTRIASCSVAGNAVDGILVGSACHVSENQCGNLSGVGQGTNTTGIHVTGNDNRIEANVLTNRHRGLDVDVGGNVIVRNVASGNIINWDIFAVNFGQFIAATNSGASFAGSAGGAPIGSTDPWINYSY